MNRILKFENAEARIFCFDGGKEVEEFHVVVSICNPLLTYQQQLETLLAAYSQLRQQELNGADAIFKRYFLSDASNQSDALMNYELESPDCAVSIVQQAPLNGTKIALWAYLATNMQRRALSGGLYEARHGQYRHFWMAGANNTAKDSERQTRIILNDYVMQLANEGCSLADNCIRTWFFVNDVDLNYAGVVKARNEVFVTQNLTDKTHFIASTGIGGRQAHAQVLSQMDAYAIDGIDKAQIHYLYAPTHLNRTSDYGVSFERGTGQHQQQGRNHAPRRRRGAVSSDVGERRDAFGRGRLHLRRCRPDDCLSARPRRLSSRQKAFRGAIPQQAVGHRECKSLSPWLAHRNGNDGNQGDKNRISEFLRIISRKPRSAFRESP